MIRLSSKNPSEPGDFHHHQLPLKTTGAGAGSTPEKSTTTTTTTTTPSRGSRFRSKSKPKHSRLLKQLEDFNHIPVKLDSRPRSKPKPKPKRFRLLKQLEDFNTLSTITTKNATAAATAKGSKPFPCGESGSNYVYNYKPRNSRLLKQLEDFNSLPIQGSSSKPRIHRSEPKQTPEPDPNKARKTTRLSRELEDCSGLPMESESDSNGEITGSEVGPTTGSRAESKPQQALPFCSKLLRQFDRFPFAVTVESESEPKPAAVPQTRPFCSEALRDFDRLPFTITVESESCWCLRPNPRAGLLL